MFTKGQGRSSALTAVAFLTVAGAAADAQQIFTDNSCVLVKEATVQKFVGRQIGRVKRLAPGTVTAKAEVVTADRISGLSDGPVCLAPTQEELLLLTGLMIDRAALSAAKGLDAAQVALGLTRTLQAAIEVRERAATGFAPVDEKETEALIQQISVESARLAIEIKSRKEDIVANPTIRAKLVEADKSLNEVAYYGASAGAGGTLFGEFMKSKEPKTALYAVLDSKEVGVGSEFARRLPDRAKKVPGTLRDTFALRRTMGDAVEDPEKADDGADRARVEAEATAQRVRKAIQPFPLTTRKDVERKNSPVPRVQDGSKPKTF